MLYNVSTQMNTAELGLFKAKKIAEVEDFVKSDIAYDEGFVIEFRMIYVAYKLYCKRHNVYAVKKGELWYILCDMGYRTLIVDKKPHWIGLVPKYVKPNLPYSPEEEEEGEEDA